MLLSCFFTFFRSQPVLGNPLSNGVPPPQALQSIVRSGEDNVKLGALEVLGNLAFCRDNCAPLLATEGLLEWLCRLAHDQVPSLFVLQQLAALLKKACT